MKESCEEKPDPVPRNKRTVAIMVAVIVMFLVGIILRWDYIKTEVSDTVKRMFATEQKGVETSE